MTPELGWTIASVALAFLVGIVIPAGVLLFKLGRTAGRIEHQVTRNGGQNNPPTIPDKLGELRSVVSMTHVAVEGLDAKLDEQSAWAREENRRIWAELARKADRQ